MNFSESLKKNSDFKNVYTRGKSYANKYLVMYMLENDQVRNLEQGLITTFNSEGGIYHQAITGKIIDPDTGLAHDFRINSNSINNEESNILKTIKNNGNQ